MAVLKEWACAAHGPFEAFVSQDETPKCPKGCSTRFVTREIRTPPAAQGVVVGTLDKLQKDIAHDFGLRDIKVNEKDGTSVMENLRKGEKPADFAPFWAKNPDLKSFKPTDALKAASSPYRDGKLPSLRPDVIVGRHNAPLPEV